MSPVPDVIRIPVQDCVLRFTEKRVTLPVMRFRLTFALNQIPDAEVAPALGQPLQRQGKRFTLGDVEENDAVELVLKVNAAETVLLEGVVAGVTSGDNPQGMTRKLSGLILIKHKAVMLAGNPPVSFTYISDRGGSLNEFNVNRLDSRLFSLVAASGANLYPLAMFQDEFFKSQGPGAGYFPSKTVAYMVKRAALQFTGRYTEAEINAMIRDYDPANLSALIDGVTTFRMLADLFTRTWASQNTWEAMVRTLNQVYLFVVPYNRGFYIANPYGLNRIPSVQVRSQDYVSIRQKRVDDLREPVDGVAIMLPVSKGVTDRLTPIATFPDRFERGTLNIAPNKYYHFREFPAWLLDFRRETYGNSKGDPPENEIKEPNYLGEVDTRVKYYQEIAPRVARAIFGQLQAVGKTMDLVFPWRTDLMPGTVIQVENAGQRDASFLGVDLFGMVAQTTFSCDLSTASPSFAVYTQITSIRNAEDNASDNLTFVNHPLYEGPWVGTDLFGTLLRKPAEGSTVTRRLQATFDTGDGKIKPLSQEQ